MAAAFIRLPPGIRKILFIYLFCIFVLLMENAAVATTAGPDLNEMRESHVISMTCWLTPG